jgi:lysosomal acid lipase/cholesteryl ester hydrolase
MLKKVLIGSLVSLGSYIAYRLYINQVKLPPEAFVSFEDYCKAKGYSVQAHQVTTEDGYILKLFRVCKDNTFTAKKSPVLMVHGLTHSAITFIISQSCKAPAFKLIDNDYDVWLLNTRGNYLSREHTSLSPSSPEYWNWCSNHIGHYDIPSSIDYIINYTKKPKINYLGHSQGGLVALYCFSLKPEYGDKVNMAALLGSPGGIISDTASYLKPIVDSRFISQLETQKIYCFGDHSKTPFEISKFSAAFPRIAAYIYKSRYNVFASNEDPKVLSVYFQQFSGGTSLMNLKYLAQIFSRNSSKFYCYDYGEQENIKKYGTSTPPYLDYSNIRCKIGIFYGKYDLLCTPSDGKILLKEIPQDKIIFSKLDYETDHSGLSVSRNQEHMDKIVELFDSFEV